MERASCQGDDKSGPQDMLPYSGSTQKGWGKSTSTWVSQAPPSREGFHWVAQHLLPATDKLGGNQPRKAGSAMETVQI